MVLLIDTIVIKPKIEMVFGMLITLFLVCFIGTDKAHYDTIISILTSNIVLQFFAKKLENKCQFLYDAAVPIIITENCVEREGAEVGIGIDNCFVRDECEYKYCTTTAPEVVPWSNSNNRNSFC